MSKRQHKSHKSLVYSNDPVRVKGVAFVVAEFLRNAISDLDSPLNKAISSAPAYNGGLTNSEIKLALMRGYQTAGQNILTEFLELGEEPDNDFDLDVGHAA